MRPSADFVAALRATEDGLVLDVTVTAAARTARFPDGFDPWRRRVGIRVTAAPVAGAANADVCRLVASFFGVPSGHVTIVSGVRTAHKSVHVRGLRHDEAARRLGEALA